MGYLLKLHENGLISPYRTSAHHITNEYEHKLGSCTMLPSFPIKRLPRDYLIVHGNWLSPGSLPSPAYRDLVWFYANLSFIATVPIYFFSLVSIGQWDMFLSTENQSDFSVSNCLDTNTYHRCIFFYLKFLISSNGTEILV